MIEYAPLAPGTRVRLRSASHSLDLRSDTGRVVRRGDWDGYYIVRLDQPAIYHDGSGSTSELQEIIEAADNMETVAVSLTDFIDKAYADRGITELADLPIAALQGVSVADAEAIQRAFGVKTIRQLAESKFIRVAQAIALLAGAR